jgi:hypothetical protein
LYLHYSPNSPLQGFLCQKINKNSYRKGEIGGKRGKERRGEKRREGGRRRRGERKRKGGEKGEGERGR